jgi:hypothetical protein
MQPHRFHSLEWNQRRWSSKSIRRWSSKSIRIRYMPHVHNVNHPQAQSVNETIFNEVRVCACARERERKRERERERERERPSRGRPGGRLAQIHPGSSFLGLRCACPSEMSCRAQPTSSQILVKTLDIHPAFDSVSVDVQLPIMAQDSVSTSHEHMC